MKLSRFALVAALSAALGGVAATAVLPPPVWAGDKDLKKLEALKAKREEFRKKKKEEGKFPFFDLSYAADTKSMKETRWTQTDPPPFQEVSEDKGGQFFATFSPDITKGSAIEIKAIKYIHGDSVKKLEYSMNFEHAGISCKCADKDKMIEGFYLDEKRRMKDVIEDKCVEPKKAKVGPAKAYASVTGTDAQSGKRKRVDFYMWTDPNVTWILIVEINDKFIDEEGITDKAEDLIRSIKPLKAPD